MKSVYIDLISVWWGKWEIIIKTLKLWTIIIKTLKLWTTLKTERFRISSWIRVILWKINLRNTLLSYNSRPGDKSKTISEEIKDAMMEFKKHILAEIHQTQKSIEDLDASVKEKKDDIKPLQKDEKSKS